MRKQKELKVKDIKYFVTCNKCGKKFFTNEKENWINCDCNNIDNGGKPQRIFILEDGEYEDAMSYEDIKLRKVEIKLRRN